MGEYIIGNMNANGFNEIQKARFLIIEVDTMVIATDLTDSKTVAITVLEICVRTQMVTGES